MGQLKHFHFYGIVCMQHNFICIYDATQTRGESNQECIQFQVLCSFTVNKYILLPVVLFIICVDKNRNCKFTDTENVKDSVTAENYVWLLSV